MTIELRRYTINKGKLNEFVDAWYKGVYPLRQKFGFLIEGAWVVRERNEFVWVVSYDGDWAAREKEYYESPERAAVNPNPADFIARAEHWFVTSPLPRG